MHNYKATGCEEAISERFALTNCFNIHQVNLVQSALLTIVLQKRLSYPSNVITFTILGFKHKSINLLIEHDMRNSSKTYKYSSRILNCYIEQTCISNI